MPKDLLEQVQVERAHENPRTWMGQKARSPKGEGQVSLFHLLEMAGLKTPTQSTHKITAWRERTSVVFELREEFQGFMHQTS